MHGNENLEFGAQGWFINKRVNNATNLEKLGGIPSNLKKTVW